MKKKILIIDDEVDLVDLVKLRLEAHEYYVVPLYSGTRAMEIAKREKPDLILLDIMMLGIDGYTLCRKIKGDEELKKIPVILFTAKPQQKEFIKKDFESVGADDYILKPFEPFELVSKIEAVLRSRE